MNRNIYLLAGVFLIISLLRINSLAAEKSDKIGFINLKEIMQNSNAGKKAGEDFKKLYEKDTKAIKTAEAELKKLKDDLDKQGSTVTPGAKSEKEKVYRKKLRDFQLKVEDTNQALKKRDQEMTKNLVPMIMKIVRSIAEKEKYTLILDTATMPVPYYEQESDISKKVIDQLNKAKQ